MASTIRSRLGWAFKIWDGIKPFREAVKGWSDLGKAVIGKATAKINVSSAGRCDRRRLLGAAVD